MDELVTRRSADLLGQTWASFSLCGTYRYELARRWADGPLLRFVLLNPSKATHVVNDHTWVRCVRRVQRAGYAGVLIQNLFALRATEPADMLAHPAPIGPCNDRLLAAPSAPIAATVLGWGVHGTHRGRCYDVAELLTGPVSCLAVNAAGQPRHPLYVAMHVQPTPYTVPDRPEHFVAATFAVN
ncbi:MAG: hypothetical protein DLM59_11510 [Pseudonocardiales bacterium]|nr:MAG: hypothetical protein DLM59_11510 [Pseudonocardiales bacterium]